MWFTLNTGVFHHQEFQVTIPSGSGPINYEIIPLYSVSFVFICSTSRIPTTTCMMHFVLATVDLNILHARWKWVEMKNQNNRYKVLRFHKGCYSTNGPLSSLLQRVVYVVCSSKTLVQTDNIIRYKVPKDCHRQYKSYYFRYNVKKQSHLFCFQVLFTISLLQELPD